jgi:hypothetical protein
MMLTADTKARAADGGIVPEVGARLITKSAPPDDNEVLKWLGPAAFGHWAELRNWIEKFYPGVFARDWLYGGKNSGWSLRYKRTKAFVTLIPEYRRLSALVVMGRAEREKLRRGATSGVRKWSSSTTNPKPISTENGWPFPYRRRTICMT